MGILVVWCIESYKSSEIRTLQTKAAYLANRIYNRISIAIGSPRAYLSRFCNLVPASFTRQSRALLWLPC